MTDPAFNPSLAVGLFEWTDAAGNIQNLTFDCVVSEEWDEGATVTEHPVEVGANVADHVRVLLPKCQLKIRSTNEPIDANAFDVAQDGPLQLTVQTPSWVKGPGVITYPAWNDQINLRALSASLGAALVGAPGGAGAQAAAAVLAGVGLNLALQGEKTTATVQTDAGLTPPAAAPPAVAQVQQWPKGLDYVEMTHALLVQLKNSAQLINYFGTKQTEYSMVIETLSFTRSDETGTGEDVTVGLKKVRIVSTQVVTAPIPHLSGGGGNPPSNKGGQDPQPVTRKSQAVAAVNLGKKLFAGASR